MSSGGGSDDLVMLEDPIKLRKLALLLLNQEVALCSSITSGEERNKYLDNCNDSYNGVIKLMDDSKDLTEKYKKSTDDIVKIAETIHKYITYCINMSMQCIRNTVLRWSCVKKINAHFVELSEAIGKLEPGDLPGTKRLTELVIAYKNYMWECTDKMRSSTARSWSYIYSKMLEQKGTTLEDLINEEKKRLKFTKEFAELSEAEQLQVYQGILEESKRVTMSIPEVIFGSIGVAVLVVTVGLIVFDVFESGYKLEVIVRDSFEAIADIGAYEVQLAVNSAIVAEAEFEGASILLVAGASFLAGVLAALIFTVVSAYIVDTIFSNGGKIELETVGLVFHKLEVPDGMAIAYELSHEDD